MVMARAGAMYFGLNIDMIWPYVAQFYEIVLYRLPFPLDPRIKKMVLEARTAGAEAYDVTMADPELIAYYIVTGMYFVIFVREKNNYKKVRKTNESIHRHDKLPSIHHFLIHFLLKVFVCFRVLFMPDKHAATRTNLLLCLGIRGVPSLLPMLGMQQHINLDIVVCDGLFLSVVIMELVVSRMARREMTNLMPLMALLSLLDKFLILFIVVFYFSLIVHGVATHLNLPVFLPGL